MAEEAVEKQAEATPEKKSGKLKLILMGLFMLGFLGESGFLLYMQFFKAKEVRPATEKKETKRGKKGSGENHEGTRARGALSMEPFLVNLADASSNRYARITLKLGLNLKQEEILEKIVKNEVVMSKIRDEILSTLSSKKSDELMTGEGRAALRKEIIDRINKVLREGEVEEVFFTDFVVQL